MAGPTAGPTYWRILGDAWRAYIHRAGTYQSRVLLNVMYFVFLGPGALAARIFGSGLLDLNQRARPSYWTERAPTNATLEDLRRQF